MTRPDETMIMDRDEESSRFFELLECKSSKRVYVVSNRSGTGKTALLRKLRLQCEVDHDVAVALAQMTDFKNKQDEFSLVSGLHKALKATGADLPNFEQLDQARGFGNTAAFLERVQTVAAAVDMRNAAVSGAAKIAAMMYNIEHADTVVLPEWNAETDEQARALCVEAFLADLANYTQSRIAVLLLDSLDEVGEDLRRWVLSELVRKQAIGNWPSRRLVVALAGQGLTEMVYGRLPKAEHECIQTLTEFGGWTLEQVKIFLAANGFTDLSHAEARAIHVLLDDPDFTLADAIFFATTMQARRRT